MRRISTKQLATDAVLCAMCAALGALSLDFGNLKLSFEGLPVVVGALLFGPLDGLAVGALGTLLYQLLRYGLTVTTPLWILPYALCGLATGLLFRRGGTRPRGRRLTSAIALGQLVILLGNTLALYVDSRVYGYYSAVYIFGSLPLRFAVCAGKCAVYAVLLPPLLDALERRAP